MPLLAVPELGISLIVRGGGGGGWEDVHMPPRVSSLKATVFLMPQANTSPEAYSAVARSTSAILNMRIWLLAVPSSAAAASTIVVVHTSVKIRRVYCVEFGSLLS